MNDEKEFAAFKELLSTHVRRLADRSGRYISRMGDKDRERVLEIALQTAWQNIEVFDPEKMSLLFYWDVCMRDALLTRPVWPLRRLGGWDYDYTPRLLKSVKPVGEIDVDLG